jgi:hypothetical protein
MDNTEVLMGGLEKNRKASVTRRPTLLETPMDGGGKTRHS